MSLEIEIEMGVRSYYRHLLIDSERRCIGPYVVGSASIIFYAHGLSS